MKTKALCSAAERVFGDKAKITPCEAGFLSILELRTEKSAAELAAEARKEGIAVSPVQMKDGKTRLMLSCASVPAEQYPEALDKLCQCVFG